MRVVGASADFPFGRIDALAALPDGGVIVFDGRGDAGPSLLKFAADGRFLRRVGRAGSGPGEYRSAASGDLLALKDGGIALRDQNNARVSWWDANGGFVHEQHLSFRSGGPAPHLVPGLAGSLYVRAGIPGLNRVGSGAEYVFLHLDQRRGILDTVRPPVAITALESPGPWFAPQVRWQVLQDGRLLVSTGRQLDFTVASATAAMRAGHPSLPVPVAAGERAELLASFERNEKLTHGAFTNPGVASSKSAVSDLLADMDSRVFLRRHVPAVRVPRRAAATDLSPAPEFVEPPLFSVFEISGRYLGDIAFPVEARQLSFAKDVAWGVVEDADGSQILVKWRIAKQ